MTESELSVMDMLSAVKIVRASSSLTCFACLDNETSNGWMEGRTVSIGALVGTILLCDDCIQALKDTIKKANGQ